MTSSSESFNQQLLFDVIYADPERDPLELYVTSDGRVSAHAPQETPLVDEGDSQTPVFIIHTGTDSQQ